MSAKADLVRSDEAYLQTALSPRSSDEQTDCGLIALCAGWIVTGDIADATAYEDIAGQWCGDVTDYVFGPDTLTVKFHDDRPDNVFKITAAPHKNWAKLTGN